ncbi:MAG: hypothetical protein JF571_03615 [Asticcacaulis sp.]|nr:hypothetical protein [Asticcacaulis sp.]
MSDARKDIFTFFLVVSMIPLVVIAVVLLIAMVVAVVDYSQSGFAIGKLPTLAFWQSRLVFCICIIDT